MKKVSVIVLIFQVGPYVRQCLESILSQTYENIEVLCVVGNTDDVSMQITKEFADKDSRIVFLPHDPCGIAESRNMGMKAATGDYISFVDGDDYIDNDMIETMVNALESHEADISIIGKYYYYKNISEGFSRDGDIELGQKEAMEEILSGDNFFLHLWDKLYKRELFNDIEFREGAICEDRQVCQDLLLKSKKTVFVPKSKYYFRQSLDSSSKIYRNADASLNESNKICKKILDRFNDLEYDVKLYLVKEYMSRVQTDFLYNKFSKDNDKEYIEYIKKHMFEAMKSKHVYKGIIVKMFWIVLFPVSFGKMTVKRREEFLKTHEHFSSGTDWDKIFTEQGINS
ncbi:MAG: glycosyltransferase family A protein [Lachnospiraceae bacterium]|nr:glycosyltransferase family A protein [Lachnospiraceae bacterium]